MKFCFAIIVLALACPSALATANEFVDQMIHSMKDKPSIDPFVIPQKTIEVDRKHHKSGLHLIGNLKFSDIKITGLSHIQRVGDANLTSEDGSFFARIHLGDKHVKVSGDLSVDVLKFLHPHLKFDAEIGTIAVKISITMNDGKAELKEFDIDQFNHFHFHIYSLSILDPIIDIAADAFVAIFNTQVRHFMTVELRTLIEDKLKNFNSGNHSF